EDGIPDVGTRYISSTLHTSNPIESPKRPNGVKSQSLGAIIGTYKAAVTRQNRVLLGDDKSVPVWQTRYHDHIIRDERGLNYLREYILNNPAKWADDVFYKQDS